MTAKQALLAAAAISLIALSPPGRADGMAGHDMSGHSGPDMPGMDHEAIEAKLADTSAFVEKGDPAKASRTIKLYAKEMQYNFDRLDVAAGETVTIQLTNNGTKVHELTLGDEAYQALAHQMMEMMADMGMDPLSPAHLAMHETAGNTVIVKPGETKSLTWKFTKPGNVLFECNFTGHSEAGMGGTIVVK